MTGLYDRLDGLKIFKENGCIILNLKKIQRGGHSIIAIGKKRFIAHRVVWELEIGPIPNKMQINHKCEEPRCVNTKHLYIGTQKDNIRDCIAAGKFPWKNLIHCNGKAKRGRLVVFSAEERRERHKAACKRYRQKLATSESKGN